MNTTSNKNAYKQSPLAERMRPSTLQDVIGQLHLLGEGKPLRLAFASGEPHSMILWGPPGVGKTTLARLMADAFHCEFIALSAVLSGIKDIREAVERAQILVVERFCLSMKYIVSTKVSKMHFCRMSRAACSLLLAPRRKIHPLRSIVRCCRVLLSMF